MTQYQSQLKYIISNSEYNQVKLSTKLNVTIVAFNRWINGHSVPRKKHLIKIESIYLKLSGSKVIKMVDSKINFENKDNKILSELLEKDWLIHKIQYLFSRIGK